MWSSLKEFLLNFYLKVTRNSQRFWFWPCSVQFDSAVWCTPRSLTPRHDAHSGAWLCGMMHTVEFFEKFGALDSSEWCKLWSLTPRCDSHCGVWEMRNFDHLTPQCASLCGIWLQHWVWLRGVMHTADSDSAVGCTPWSVLKIQISQQDRNWIRKYFSLFIRGPEGFESWKKEGENLVTHFL